MLNVQLDAQASPKTRPGDTRPGLPTLTPLSTHLPMDFESDDWSSLLNAHPIFSSSTDNNQLEIYNDSPLPAGRRQVMVLKDADLIVAIGKELRVTSLGDAKLGKGKSKSYKVPITYCMALSSSSNLLL